MGNLIRTLSERASLIALDETWIEGNSIQQLLHTSQLSGMHKVVGMPDLHAGRGYPVGAAFFSTKVFYPALVGNDIGCGMGLWQTDLDAARVRLDALDQKLGNLDSSSPDTAVIPETLTALALNATMHSALQRHAAALGTIGGGNHFMELQQLDQIFNPLACTALGLDRKKLQVLVHSGSRGLGEAILRAHVDQHGHAGLDENSASAKDYWAWHTLALGYAQTNRQRIATRIGQRLRCALTPVLDVNHNWLGSAECAGVTGWLHRKGATPADAGVVIIPGSRGDYSYLVQPHATADSLYSIAHGAGRKWMRSECQGRLQRYNRDQLSRTALGSRVICNDRALIYEEAPQAYKPIDSIIGALQAAGLIEVLARLKPVLTYKTRGGCCP